MAATETKAKVEMYQFVLTHDAEDAAKATSLQQEHMSAHEHIVERMREDQARRD